MGFVRGGGWGHVFDFLIIIYRIQRFYSATFKNEKNCINSIYVCGQSKLCWLGTVPFSDWVYVLIGCITRC